MNILLVCDDEDFSEQLASRLIFLRKNDAICKSDYINAQREIILKNPDVILICESPSNDETIDLIKIIRRKADCPIVLVTTTCDQEFILNCYDLGINDFVTSIISDYELVFRIINNVKYNSLRKENGRFIQLLNQLKVYDETLGVVNYNYSKQVIENYTDKNLITDGSFMVITPTKENKTHFSSENLAKAIKKSVRKDDIITLGKGINYYVFMPNTDFNGAVSVLNKVKENLDFNICAGISDISGNSFDNYENDALKAVMESLTLEKDFTFSECDKVETLDDWLDDKSSQDYRIFRQMFNKKLEKVITPVFYRLQKAYEEKLFNTEIEQYVDENQCVFNLKNKKGNSSLKIIYPGFAKITILIEHEGLDSPENKEIKLPLAKITKEELVEIVENFIKEYKENVIG